MNPPLPPAPPGKSGWPWSEEPGSIAPSSPENDRWPRISVVTPSLNQGEFIEETIRSVLLQNYPNLEYLVLDGGSTDGSVGIIRKYAGWLAYWISQSDRGQSHAINQGFANASGEIFAWLNSDDVYAPEALLTAARCFRDHPDAVLVYGDADEIAGDGSWLGRNDHVRPFDYRWLLEEDDLIAQPSAFFRREAFFAAGALDESLRYCMDWDLWLRLGKQGLLIYMPQRLSKMRMHPESKTLSGGRRQYADLKRIFERHGRGLPSAVVAWLVSNHLDEAFHAYRRGDVVAGQDELAYVMENAPEWGTDTRRLAREVAGWAWRLLPEGAEDGSKPIEFAEEVCRHLPRAVASPALLRGRVLGLVYEALAFRSHAQGRPRAVRRYAWGAVARDAARLMNRGLWSITVRSAFRKEV